MTRPASPPAPVRTDSLFLRACRRERVPRPPVWMMRQAGRYLPEYRAVRESVSFLDLCKRADLATEVTLQPVRRFDFDAAIIFSDILLPLIGMGAEFRFDDQGGPKLAAPMDSAAALAHLQHVDARLQLPWVHEALRRTRAELSFDKALLGFAGAPFTLLAYLVEGETSRLFPRTKQLLLREPRLAEQVLQLLADQIGEYLAAQVEAGADAVQLFDTWAGLLHPDDFEQFALPYARQVFDRVVQTGAPSIYYVNGGAALVEAQSAAGSTVIGVDWRMRLRDVRRRVPANVGIQGNLDPVVLLGTPDQVRRRTQAMLDEMAGRAGYIVNLGHGVVPQTPLECVEAFVAAVKQSAPATA
jgi:uroporphyrinogen decarboxylase